VLHTGLCGGESNKHSKLVALEKLQFIHLWNVCVTIFGAQSPFWMDSVDFTL